jgi:hypothetical protein
MCSLNSDHLGPEGVVRVQRYLGTGVDQTTVRELRHVDGRHLKELTGLWGGCGQAVHAITNLLLEILQLFQIPST